MYKGQKRKQVEQDEKGQSRMGLKNKIQSMGGGQFDLSAFTDSNNDNQRFSSMFPQLNEPTLEDSLQGYNLKQVEDNSVEQYYGEGLTARNSSNKSKINQSALLELQMVLENLRGQLQKKDADLEKYKKTNQIVQSKLKEMQKEDQRKNKKIQKLQNELTQLKNKRSLPNEYSSRQSSQYKSIISENLSDFCPQLLSPQETVDLLTQLLRKVSKSHRMTKTMMTDSGIRQLLGKMHKG